MPAPVNAAPAGTLDEWSSLDHADAMLVAQKPLDWAGIIDPKTYSLVPNDLDTLLTEKIHTVQSEAS